MRAFKFIVKEWTDIPSRPGCSATGCAALVFAESIEQARELLRQRNVDNGSLPWEDVARVIEIDPTHAHVALLVEV